VNILKALKNANLKYAEEVISRSIIMPRQHFNALQYFLLLIKSHGSGFVQAMHLHCTTVFPHEAGIQQGLLLEASSSNHLMDMALCILHK